MRCVERGCGWEGTVGTLEDHVTKCDFTMTPCPNGCKDANEVIIKYFRKELEEHLSSECPGKGWGFNSSKNTQYLKGGGLYMSVISKMMELDARAGLHT